MVSVSCRLVLRFIEHLIRTRVSITTTTLMRLLTATQHTCTEEG